MTFHSGAVVSTSYLRLGLVSLVELLIGFCYWITYFYLKFPESFVEFEMRECILEKELMLTSNGDVSHLHKL